METGKLSPLYEKCVKVYEEMLIQSETHHEFDQQVFIGHLTDVFKAVNVPYGGYYTDVIRHLKKFNSIEQIKRGAGRAYSVWLVNNAPKREDFIDLKDRRRVQYEKQLLELDKRVRKLEAFTFGYEERNADKDS